MYFENTDHNHWDYKDAFQEYYTKFNYDLQKTAVAIKKDLESFVSRPNVLKAAAKKAQQYLDNWKKHSRDFKSFISDTLPPTPEVNASGFISNNVYGGQNVNTMNNNADNIHFYTSAGESSRSESSKKRKIAVEEEDEIDALFNPKATGIILDNSQDDEDEEPPLYFIEKDIKASYDYIGETLVDDVDVGQKFKQFMKYSVDKAKSTGLLIESHPHLILALSSILLLKENQHHKDMFRYFKQAELDHIMGHIKNNVIPGCDDIEFPDTAFLKIKKTIKLLLAKKMTRDDAIFDMHRLRDEVSPVEFDIIKITINCINKLPPVRLMENIGEIDLCTTYLDPILSPIFTDFDKEVILRWPNLKSKEVQTQASQVNKQRRPDAVVSSINQHHFTISRAFGEAKTEERKKDVYELVRDLIRVGIFCKESIDSNNMNNSIGLQAVGNSISFYFISLIGKKLYTMLEFAKITTPMSLSELPAFISQLDTLLQVKHCFNIVCSQREPSIDGSWKAPTLDSPNFKVYVHSSKDGKRPSSLVF